MTSIHPKVRSQSDLVYTLLLIGFTLVFLFLTLGSIVIGHLSLTYDEPLHFRYGDLIYHLDSNRFDDSKMPVSVLNVLPTKVAAQFFSKYFSNDWQVMSSGRISTIFVSLLLGWLCFFWARSLYGRWAGLIAFGLYVFEPNLVAHSQLITTDLYAAATLTLAIFAFWKFLEAPGLRKALLAGLALGLCQIAKYSGILLYPIFVLLALIRYWGWLTAQFKLKAWQKIISAFLQFIEYAAIFLVTSLLVINIGFLFNRTFTPLGDYQFKSAFFQSTQQISPLFNKVPIPVPYPYMEGLDFVMFRERTGDGYGNIYLLGELRTGQGFPGYFLVAALLKVPLPIIALFFVSLWAWLRTFQKDEFLRKEMYLLIPALIYSIYFNFFFEAQIGIRFLLVIFPITLIFCARVFRHWPLGQRRARILFGLAGVYLVVSVFSYFPNYLSYFNEIVLDRTQAYRYLADSNIDWGQNKAELAKFLAQHPDYQYMPTAPTSGTIVVGVNELIGVVGKPEDFQWLRDEFSPTRNFLYTYLIYDISPAEFAKKHGP
jgi:4-amino-4-deoxy-L-arabinose transferase-like glycosyltransferase